MKKFLLAATLLVLIAFAIPIEHKYDKLFRFFSLTLIPNNLVLSPQYDKKIYFYITDLLAIALGTLGLFWFRIPWRQFFIHPLWILFIGALGSIIASPFIYYPLAYIRLLQLLTPLLLFSFIAHAFSNEEKGKIYRLFMTSIVIGSLFQTSVAILQYFQQKPLGLRLLSELKTFTTFYMPHGYRWIFDRLFHHEGASDLIQRSYGTMGHANVLGGFLVLSLFATYSLYLQSRTKRSLWLITIPLQLFAMMTTYSRSALFAWMGGSILYFGFSLFKKIPIRPLALTALFSSAACLALLSDQWFERGGLFHYSATAQGSDHNRIIHQNMAFAIIKDHPIVGLGFNQFSERATPYFPNDPAIEQTAPHNIFLFLACETGIFSILALLAFSFNLIWHALRSPQHTYQIETLTLLTSFIAFLGIGLCDFYPLLFQPGKLMFFSIAGLLYAFAKQRRSTQNIPSRQESWKIFDHISPTYDRVNRVISLGLDRSWRQKVATFLPKKQNLEILDLATGTGDQILALLQSAASIQTITGIDLSQEMLRIAKEKLPPVNLLHADAQHLPFQNQTFDAATFSFGIRNVPDPSRSLQEIYRVLKPSGKCLILEFSLPSQPIRPFYLFYLRHLLPLIGGLLSRNRGAYSYLNQTIESFPYGPQFTSLMQQSGFSNIQQIKMCFGSVSLYVGEKQVG